MRAEIKKLQSELGVTTIYVTHDQVEAMTMGDRVSLMRKGVLQQVAAPEELYERPRNMFVGGFIGSPAMNMLDASVRREGGRTTVVVGDTELELGRRRRRPIRRSPATTAGQSCSGSDPRDSRTRH